MARVSLMSLLVMSAGLAAGQTTAPASPAPTTTPQATATARPTTAPTAVPTEAEMRCQLNIDPRCAVCNGTDDCRLLATAPNPRPRCYAMITSLCNDYLSNTSFGVVLRTGLSSINDSQPFSPPGCPSDGVVRPGIDTGALFCIDCSGVGLTSADVPCMSSAVNGTRFFDISSNPDVTYLPRNILDATSFFSADGGRGSLASTITPQGVVGTINVSNTGIIGLNRETMLDAFPVLPLAGALIINAYADNLNLTYGITADTFNDISVMRFSMRNARFIGTTALIYPYAFRGFRVSAEMDLSGSVFAEGGGTLPESFSNMGTSQFTVVRMENLTYSGFCNWSAAASAVSDRHRPSSDIYRAGLMPATFSGTSLLWLDMSGLRLLDGAGLHNAAFSAISALGGISMRNSHFGAYVTENETVCVGTTAVRCIENIMWPFDSAVIAGVLDLSGSEFPNAALPPGFFTGLFLSETDASTPAELVALTQATQSNLSRGGHIVVANVVPPIINLSYCNLQAITSRNTSKTRWLNGTLLDFDSLNGPFGGLIAWPCADVDQLGRSNSAIDLRGNFITRISRGDLVGVTMCTTMLSDNPIRTFQAGWASDIVTAGLSVQATGRESSCWTTQASRFSQQDNFTALNLARYFTQTSLHCSCGPGILGTGTYCDELPCSEEVARVLSRRIANGYVDPAVVQNGDSLMVHCDTGWYHPTQSSLVCRGGLYGLEHVSCQYQVIVPVVITILSIVLVLSGWFNKNYMLHGQILAPFPRSIKAWLFEILVALLIFIPGGSIYFARQHKKKIREQADQIEMKQLLLGQREAELETIRDSWRIEWYELKVDREIGRGAAGVVSRAHWLGNTVAIKELISESGFEDVTEFSNEAEIMQSLRHPNILSFYGAGVTPHGAPFVALEYAEHGSMYILLRDHLTSLSWVQRRKFAADIAAGMSYLHARNPPMIHRDLKGDNCLVGTGYVVKVADFGTLTKSRHKRSHRQRTGTVESASYRRENESEVPRRRLGTAGKTELTLTHTIGTGTPLWMAPEVLVGQHGAAHYSPKVDVYSFGITMFEIATGTLPYEEFNSLWELEERVAAGDRPVLPPGTSTPTGYVELMERCWAGNPLNRPTFKQIGVDLAKMLVDK